jgi:branched-subunit amino acid aminotransferase/4-amino-4-deoxychorismate lyase
MSHTNHDGRIYINEEAGPDSQNATLEIGDGLLETMLYTKNGIRFFEQHMLRLNESLAYIGFPEIGKEYLRKEIIKTIAAGGRTDDEVMLRCRFFMNAGDKHLHFTIETVQPQFTHTKWPDSGLRLGISQNARKYHGSASHLKTSLRLPYQAAGAEAELNGWDDALLLNAEGRIAESSHSNIFIVLENKIFTPPLTDGCINGIFRAFLLSSNFAGTFLFEERPLTIAMLQKADEIFLTNAVRGLQPVSFFMDKFYLSNITRQLFDSISESGSI